MKSFCARSPETCPPPRCGQRPALRAQQPQLRRGGGVPQHRVARCPRRPVGPPRREPRVGLRQRCRGGGQVGQHRGTGVRGPSLATDHAANWAVSEGGWCQKPTGSCKGSRLVQRRGEGGPADPLWGVNFGVKKRKKKAKPGQTRPLAQRERVRRTSPLPPLPPGVGMSGLLYLPEDAVLGQSISKFAVETTNNSANCNGFGALWPRMVTTAG